MAEMRRRKGGNTKGGSSTHRKFSVKTTNGSKSDKGLGYAVLGLSLQEIALLLIGLSIALYIGYRHAIYMNQLHENNLWFSNIKEVEREISFRTESGLYYSYYKQILLAPSFQSSVYELTHDNLTEHGHQINLLQRMNIYQELILASLYRLLPLQFDRGYILIGNVHVRADSAECWEVFQNPT